MKFGLDYLGGAKFKDVILREHPNGWAAGFFAETFGNALPVADALLATGRCPHLRMQLIWSDAHSFGDSDIPRLKSLSAQYEKLAQKYPTVRIELSPFCEHSVKNPDKYLDIVAQVAPHCFPVNSVWKGALSTKYKNEVHGGAAKVPNGSYSFSYDGQSAVDADVTNHKVKFGGSDVFFFWIPQFNLRLNTNDKTPRPQRKAVPTGKLIDSVIYLKNDKGETKLPNKFTIKTHSDQHTAPVPEPRALKPVYIIPQKVRFLELVAENGQVIGKSSAPQSFVDGRFRYYFAEFGFELAEKAGRIQGHSVCKLCGDGKVFGTVSPAFRDGDFR